MANEGRLPNAADGRVREGVLVYNRWGRPFRVTGLVCRSLAYMGPGLVQPELVNCGAHVRLVTFRESGRVG